MSDTSPPNEDDVLRRMLNMPHTEHKPLGQTETGRPPRKDKGVKRLPATSRNDEAEGAACCKAAPRS